MIFSLLFLLSACSFHDSNDPIELEETEVSFHAEIMEAHEGYLMISPENDEEEIKSADLITVSTRDVDLTEENGNEIESTMFKEGMKVEIVYDGMIAESYPAQIVKCYEIRIISK